MDFLFFLGRFHVLVLHLPIGIIFTALGLEWLTRKDPQHHYRFIAPYLWGLASITALITVTLGVIHISEGGFMGPSAIAHRLYGFSLAVTTTLVWLLCSKWNILYEKIRGLIAVVLLVLVTLTGHYGGNLTHGSTYLLEYAPSPLRAVAGLEPRRPVVENVMMADPYFDVVLPMLMERCSSCHNDDKLRGQFNITNYQATINGGESGAAIVSGNISQGELYRRITLPTNHDDFMPAEGKTALSEGQVALLAWWIEAGLPQDTRLSELDVSSTVEQLFRNELRLGGSGQSAFSADEIVGLDPQKVNTLYQAGFLVRQVSQNDPGMLVSIYSSNSDLSLEQLNVLIQTAEGIVSLNLQGAGLNDQSIGQFGALTQLTHLRVNNNKLTDDGLDVLSTLPVLESLNLYGNLGVTDKSIEVLASMSNLQDIYLWQTSISAEGIDRLKKLRPDLKIEAGAIR